MLIKCVNTIFDADIANFIKNTSECHYAVNIYIKKIIQKENKLIATLGLFF